MKIRRIPFAQVPQFSSRDVAYATQDQRLRPFYKYAAQFDNFQQVVEDKQKDETRRDVLVEVLQRQYSQLPEEVQVAEQIQRLADPNTFTVTTAHQPSLFTGPLYFIYKIISTIRLARDLQAAYPAYHFVPVFVTGGEDHDFAEINHLHLFGKTIQWDTEAGGAVGQLPTETLSEPLAQLKEILGSSEQATTIFEELRAAYQSETRYGAATIRYVHHLFGREGLVIIDMNQVELKRLFIPIMKEEMLHRPSQPLVEKAQQALEIAGFSGQAYAREINLFYLREGLRARIEAVGDDYQVVDTDYRFTQAELLAELDSHPERFSPNVIMRPLFQELILPNLAYIGGGGEIAYWIERQEQFDHFGINFPMLIRRNSVLWLDKGSLKRMKKLDLELEDLFIETEQLIKRFVKGSSDNELSLAAEKEQLEQLFTSIATKAAEIDPTLKKAVLAEHARQLKTVENLEGRLMRAEKQNYETAIQQIRSLKEKLFPGNGLQERYDNFLNFYLRYGRTFFDTLLDELDPLKEGLVVVMDE